MSISKLLQDKLALLPDRPGCYIMKDAKGKILYVGKAKVLKNRVRSYFHGVHDNKTTRLVSKIHDFEFIVTGSEKEALLLEINLIKKNHPPFNIMFMDDKSYPYIAISKDTNFTVTMTRQVKNKKMEYFGPYPSSQSCLEIVKLINRMFPIRKCKTLPKQVCLYYHMHQCLGPCVKEIPKESMDTYRKTIRRFLQGDTKDVIETIRENRDKASENLEFEKAMEYQEILNSIDHVMEKQTIDLKDRKARDVFGFYAEKGYISLQGFFLRNGKILERAFAIEELYEDPEEAFISYIVQYYQDNVLPSEILVPEGINAQLLEELLQVSVVIPQRGTKRALIDMVLKNAKEAHDQKFALALRHDQELEQANHRLNELMQKEIHTIELFDNSHIQGSHNVSGLVVYEDGKPDKKQYRHYKLGTYRSDLDSMKEVLYRRYFRLMSEDRPMPDLVLVDGGALQIQAAKEIKEALDLPFVLAGLVKDDKHTTRALMNEEFEELELDKKEPLFFLLTRMQDEVHRYAISYHRKLRGKAMTKSALDGIEGIGPKRKKSLMSHFKSIRAIKEADLEELEQVVGKKNAKALYDALHGVQ